MPKKVDSSLDGSIENDYLRLIFVNGRLRQVQNKKTGVNRVIDQNFLYYPSYNGGKLGQSSGAYIFRPNGTDAIVINGNPTISVVNGPLVNEVRQQFTYVYVPSSYLCWLIGLMQLI
jgi:hypothetical protein